MNSRREEAKKIFEAAVKSVDPSALLRSCLLYDPDDDLLTICGSAVPVSSEGRIVVVSAGKAALAMAHSAERILQDRIAEGLAVGPPVERNLLNRIEYLASAHPIPDERSVQAGARIVRTAEGLGEEDLLLLLFSGGASSMMELPAAGLVLDDIQTVNRLLLASGASIREINCVRKHLSAVKGGQLARSAAPARVIALILSDCHGNDLSVIASGPAAPDPTTFGDAEAVLRRYRVEEKIPSAILQHLHDGAEGRISETPKPGDLLFDRVRHEIIGENRTALEGASQEAKRLGYRTVLLNSFFGGEAREEAGRFLRMAESINPSRCSAVIAGAECVVTVKGEGKGGRNQEFLAALSGLIADRADLLVLSAGTDGIDGPTGSAGGIIDGNTLARAESNGVSLSRSLQENNTHAFLQAAGDLLSAGPTGTNVMDIIVLLKN